MTLFISVLVVLSTWFLFQTVFVWLRKQRRIGFTKLSQTPIREVVDNLAMIVTASSRHLNMAANQPTHTHGRLVITEQWLVLASDKGVLLRTDRNGQLKLKDLGEGRFSRESSRFRSCFRSIWSSFSTSAGQPYSISSGTSSTLAGSS